MASFPSPAPNILYATSYLRCNNVHDMLVNDLSALIGAIQENSVKTVHPEDPSLTLFTFDNSTPNHPILEANSTIFKESRHPQTLKI